MIVVVNPEEIWSRGGAETERKVLDALVVARDAGKARVVLLWNARKAGCLFGRLIAGTRKPPANPDLLLDAGIEESTDGVRRTVWGRQADGAAAFILLPVSLWIGGSSHSTGRDPFRSGRVAVEAFGLVL